MTLFSALDLRLAFRALRSRPGFSLVVVATLMLGIGTTAAMFSLLNAALLRSLPFTEANRLMVLWGVRGPEKSLRGASPAEVRDWRQLNHSMTDISVWDPMSLNLLSDQGTVRVQVERVNAGYFKLLGTGAALGRTFSPEEDQVPDAHPVVVLSHAFWNARFGGDPGIVGRSLTLDQRSFTVVGVMPEGFAGLSYTAELWLPVAMLTVDSPVSLYTGRGSRWLTAVGRIKPGITRAEAQRDLESVGARLSELYPETNKDRSVLLHSLKEDVLGTRAGLFGALFQAVLLVLLIATVNVMSLQLVRASAREREISLRLALGASRWSLARQLLAEGLLLAGLGGLGGVLLAKWCIRLLAPLAPPGVLPPYAHLSIDAGVLLFSFGVTLVCGIACGLTPLLRQYRSDPAEALREGGRALSSGLGRLRRPGLQQAFVVAEVALALMLLAGAGLMLRSMRERLAVAPGFTPDGVVAARISLPRAGYEPAARAPFAERLAERLAALPGVAAAAVASDLPLRGNENASTIVVDLPGAEPIRHYRHSVTPGFFATLGIPILAGRGFTPQDVAESPGVVVVSQAMAKRYWGGNAVGHHIRLGEAAGRELEIVGVAGTVRYRDLTTDLDAPSSEPDVYYPMTQRSYTDLDIAVQSRGGALLSAAQIQREVAAIDPGLPLFSVEPLADAVTRLNAAPRFGSLLLAVFSLIALGLAAIGLYGVISFVVGLSRREIAIRLALGADQARVKRTVIRSGMTLVAAGVVLGVVGARLGAGVLATQLYGIRATDPATLVAVTATVLLVALFASWLPARRAAAVEPQTVLKEQ